MNRTPTDAVAIAEPNPHERLVGLVSGMKRGMIESFEYEGLKIRRVNSSVVAVNPLTGQQLGGRHLLAGVSYEDLAEWVETKADHYK